MSAQSEEQDPVEIWRQVIIGDDKSWALFAHGTCVILTEPVDDVAAQAVAILREYGPVRVGTAAADFDIIDLVAAPGWAVTGHHPDVLTYVAPEEVAEPTDLTVGLIGRAKRDCDGQELEVVHVEDRRR